MLKFYDLLKVNGGFDVATKCYIDFSISNENEGSVLNAGLCAQKEDFGGRTVAYDQYVLDLKQV